MSSIIELTNITKVYKLYEVTSYALKNVNLTIHKNELISIMGESGSGKSTLINIIGLLDRPTEGSYLLDKKEVSLLTDDERANIRNHKIGFVFQSFCLLPRLNSIQNIALPLLYRGLKMDEAQERAYEMLKKVNIVHLAEKKPNQMSGGQQQRVAIARALIGNPEVILADEPTGALDSATSSEILELFTYLHKHEKTTIIIVTHSQHISEQCERAIILTDGSISSDKKE